MPCHLVHPVAFVIGTMKKTSAPALALPSSLHGLDNTDARRVGDDALAVGPAVRVRTGSD